MPDGGWLINESGLYSLILSSKLPSAKRFNHAFAYDKKNDVIIYKPTHRSANSYDENFVFAHEISHRMDILFYRSWENETFLSAIDHCQEKVLENKKEVEKWFYSEKHFKSYALSDIISALAANEKIDIPVGHLPSYWEKKENRALEIFANLSAIDVLGLEEKEPLLQELIDAYKEIIHATD